MQRVSIVPLQNCHYELSKVLPIDLGFGTQVNDLSTVLSNVALDKWSQYVAPEAQKEIKSWRICLEHRYESNEGIGKDEQSSAALLGYIVGHLRFAVPTITNANRILHANISSSGLDPFRLTSWAQQIFTEKCEIFCTEITEQKILTLKSWMPWIVDFRQRWKDLFPLYLSLYFSEKAYFEQDPKIRYLFRAMALEALFSTDTVYGKKALVSRLVQFIGGATDLYGPYRTELQPDLPKLLLKDVIGDICTLRNKIAHGDVIPPNWLVHDQRPDAGGKLTYSEVLFEAATSLVSAVWGKILGNNLQQTFGDKASMAAYLP